jgi:hypothetical protein
VRKLMTADPDAIVWVLSSVELLSVLARLARQTPQLAEVMPGVRLDALELFRHGPPSRTSRACAAGPSGSWACTR